MDIVKQINEHTERLVKGLANTSLDQRKSLTISILGFYFQLPNFKETIYKYLHFKVKKQQLIADITNDNIQTYQDAVNQSNADTDVYSDGYEEPDPMELFVLDAFASATSDLKFSSNIVALFIGIIDTLDYYENFSDRPEYWNDLLEKEVEFQKEILIQLRSNDTVSASMYKKRYENVEFVEL